jgi:predicted acetyltransferase
LKKIKYKDAFALEFMALCLDYQKSISVDSYLFIDNEKVKYELDNFRDVSFRLGEKSDIETIKNKCDSAFEGYYEDLIKNDQLFVLYDGNNLLGIGEFRIIKTHGGKYGDIGMHVVEVYYRKGIGTYIMIQLKEHCYSRSLIPMASCDVQNIASKRTLEKWGFITNHRIICVNFN